jgi:hypothetical protein
LKSKTSSKKLDALEKKSWPERCSLLATIYTLLIVKISPVKRMKTFSENLRAGFT